MTDISSQTLHVVAKELAVTLGDARASLEGYAERPDHRELMEKCADQLHLAHGVLRLVEVYGAALLAEEMEHVTRYLIDTGGDQKRQTDGLDALMRAMVQLPTYLERVLSGGRDLALVLLPLLNDLRSARGSPLLSEGTLLLLNLKSDQPAQPQAAHPGEQPISLTQWARRLRPRFQVGLLGYIRDARAEQNLEIMAKVAEKLEQVATTQPVFQFWWVTGAVLEALRAHGLEGSVTLKRLLGQADRQIKSLYESGEVRYCENPPIDLLNNLLYYVARASTTGGRIGAVRASFKLSELLPVDESIEEERQSLSAPSVKLMHTVAAAIKEDLSKVKDVLDIFVRRGGGRIEELAPQLDLLKKISDTLGVLGLGEQRQRVQQEISGLSEFLSQGNAPPEDALVKIAGVLLSVEDSLDDQLVRLILPTPQAGAGHPADEDAEFRQVSEAVLRECIVNLAHIKEAVSVAVQKSGDFGPQGLDNVPQLLRGITAGLLMLGKGRAVELMDGIGKHVRRLVEPGAPVHDALRLERIADAIVSIEYYMETLQSGRTDPWYMLDNAEICIRALAEDAPAPVRALAVTAAAPTGEIRQTPEATVALDRNIREQASTHPLIVPTDMQTLDPQFVELFIEEAKEEITSIERSFPRWDQNPMDLESLVTMRRSVHTLKGSGRMVGARMIGEFAWSIENLLNRVIDKTLTRTPGMMSTMRAAVAALPHLVEQLETGRPLSVPVDEIMSRAYAYAEGRGAEQRSPTATMDDVGGATFSGIRDRVPAPPEPAAAPEPPVIHEAAVAHEAVAHEATAAHEAAVAAEAPSAPAEAEGADGAQIAAEPFRTVVLPRGYVSMPHLETPSSPEVQPHFETVVMDPALHDIFSKETASHIAVIRDYLHRRLGQPGPHDLPEGVYRAIHTLSGSSKMAEARHGIRITEPLNRYMRKVFDSGRGLSDAGLEMLADAVTAIENVVSHINESSGFFSDQASILERLQQLDTDLDQSLAHADGEASLSAITPATAPEDEFDHEIANIYSEEATELLEAAQISLTAWNGARNDKERVAELQRQLHTLKGGARMAEIAPMGDLSHELETLVIQIDVGAVSGDDHAHGVMQASLDELARMRDLVSQGSMPPPATALIEQIRRLTAGERAGAPLPVTPSVAAQPVAEPPVAEAPTTAAPVAEAPVSEAPVSEAPVEAAPTSEAPVAEAPVAEAPVTETPTEAAPTEAAVPAAEAPVAEAPIEQVPIAEMPFAEATIAEPSVAEAPTEAAPAEAAPATEAPIEEPTIAYGAAAGGTPGPVVPVLSLVPPPVQTEEADATAGERGAAVGEAGPAGEAAAAPVLPGRESAPVERAEMARVDADLLDTMLNNAGEVSIFRARLDQQVNSIDFNLAELARTVIRLKDQLRGLEIETEAQVLNRHRDEDERRDDFDPLELDRYSALQQFSRALAETSSDVASIQGLLETLTREAQSLLTQQARVITELQNSLMRTRMVPFQRHVQRLTRLVRQAANDTGKRAELSVQGAAAELDRQVLERMVPPLEHMLRNAVVHGVEVPERRTAFGKPEVGRISVSLERDGAEVVIVVADDGAGINVKLIREKAISLGLTDPQAKLTDEEAMQLILEPGFSTAGRVTQAAGRGVGMDVVATEVKKLGGGLFIESAAGKGSRFTIRLPFTLAISQALIVRVAEEVYALPLATVEGVVRLPKNIVARHLGKDAPLFEYGGQKYRFQQLGAFVGLGPTRLPDTDVSMSVVLIRAGEHSTALVTDELVGSREIVVKSLGPQISAIRGIAGATILGDGRIVVILDMGALVRSEWRARPTEAAVPDPRDRRTFAMVVDDSITVRRVTQRLLERNGMRVLTAKDGVDALSLLQDNLPDIILLDVEMPRMDGYEVAAHVRADPRLKAIPIVMITSRVSEKHRARAIELGVDDYLGKPYQESQLLDAIEPLVHGRRAIAR
jgi:chemosensory pili system protein ChpA (sensor histidine kinase/response regulator)